MKQLKEDGIKGNMAFELANNPRESRKFRNRGGWKSRGPRGGGGNSPIRLPRTLLGKAKGLQEGGGVRGKEVSGHQAVGWQRIPTL